VLMDYCDIWLPLAKMLRYLSLPALCDMAFTWWFLSWFVTRHVLFILVIISVARNDFAKTKFGPDQVRNKDLGNLMSYGFTGSLVAFQIIQMIWFTMICRVAWRVLTGKGAEDVRSDDEGDDPVEEAAADMNGTGPTPGTPELRRRK